MKKIKYFTQAYVLGLSIALLVFPVYGQWEEANHGLYGGWISSYASQGGLLFVGTVGSGVFRSEDLGATWNPTNSGIGGERRIFSIISTGSVLLASTELGVVRSHNNANSWESSNSGMPSSVYIQGMVKVGTTIFAAATFDKVFKSVDEGMTWTAANSGLTDVFVVTAVVGLGNDVYIATDKGVFVSADNGATWQGAGLNEDVHKLINTNNFVYASVNSGNWRTNDLGQNWDQTTYGVLSSAGGKLFRRSGGSISVSTDEAQNWSPFYDQTIYGNILEVYDNGQVALISISQRGLIRKANDETNWSPASMGITNLEIKSIASGPDVVVAGSVGGGLFRSENEGVEWVPANAGITSYHVYSLFHYNGVFFAGTLDGVFRSVDGGQNWQLSNNGITPVYATATNFTAKADSIFAATSQYGIFVSTDAGLTWTSINDGLPGLSIFSIEATGGAIYATVGAWDQIYRLDPSSSSWVGLGASTLPGPVRAVQRLNNRLYAATGADLYFMDANAWNSVNLGSGVFAVPIQDLLVTGADRMVAATRLYGVYQTLDGGGSWKHVNEGLAIENPIIEDLELSNSMVFVGTSSNGVWRTNLASLCKPAAPVLTINSANAMEPLINSNTPAGTEWFLDGVLLVDKVESSIVANQPGDYTARVNVPGCDPSDLSSTITAPELSWQNPSSIIYGTQLGSSELNATAPTAGSFSYDPPEGTELDAGTHTLSVSFFPTSPTYVSAYQEVEITVNKADQTITFELQEEISLEAGSLPLLAESTSGLPITFSSSDESVATVENNNTFNIVGPGVVSVLASQPGNDNYNAAPTVERTIVVVEAPITQIDREKSDLMVYPNPARELLFIRGVVDDFVLQDVFGRTISVASSRHGEQTELKLDQIPAGLFLLTLSTPSGYQVRKIIKK